MGKYIVPKCECGADLYRWEEEMHEILTPITANGSFSKKNIVDTVVDGGAFERLKCRKCHNEYVMERDEKGRIIRGDVW